MLDKTNLPGPYCLKCKKPTSFLSVELVEGKTGTETVAVFLCDGCGMLLAESVGKVAAA